MQTKLQCVCTPCSCNALAMTEWLDMTMTGLTGNDWTWLDNTKAPAFRHVFHFLTIALHTAEYIKRKLTQHDTTWHNMAKQDQ